MEYKLYKSKKQNYPGLYGKFNRIDSTNFEDEQRKHKKPDYSSDADFEDLDNLIRTIKEKTQEYAEPVNHDPEPLLQKVKKPVTEEKNYDSELDKLKKSGSILNSVYPSSRSCEHPDETDSEDAIFSKMITDSDFLDDLESDMIGTTSDPVYTYDFPEIEQEVKQLLFMLEGLSPSERNNLLEKDYISNLLKKLNR